jgi:hypothetical protein
LAIAKIGRAGRQFGLRPYLLSGRGFRNQLGGYHPIGVDHPETFDCGKPLASADSDQRNSFSTDMRFISTADEHLFSIHQDEPIRLEWFPMNDLFQFFDLHGSL